MTTYERIVAKLSTCDERTVFSDDTRHQFSEIMPAVALLEHQLEPCDVQPGDVICYQGAVSLRLFATILLCIKHQYIFMPVAHKIQSRFNEFDIVPAKVVVTELGVTRNDGYVLPEHVRAKLATLEAAGVVLFSSGTTGQPKAMLHSLNKLAEKHLSSRLSQDTIGLFLLFDHMGGLNTMLYSLCSGSCLVNLNGLSVTRVIQRVLDENVSILPTTPTFLNMFLAHPLVKERAFPALRLVTYGTEPMPESTLKRLAERFPAVNTKQTYGLSEIGVIPTQSAGPTSTWFKIGIPHLVSNGRLYIKADTQMIGYLNAPELEELDGYLATGDRVEEQDGYLRILGRDSDLINVGGLKVYPTEVESVILDMPEIEDVRVWGKRNPVTGHIVAASLVLTDAYTNCDQVSLITKVKAHCRAALESYKVPMIVEVSQKELHNDRYKKWRGNGKS